MNVRMLEDVEYKPTERDNLRCYGQLLMRPSRIEEDVEIQRCDDAGNVTETIHSKRVLCGPMVTYFPKGSTPELADDIAMGFIHTGLAERIDLEVTIARPGEAATWVEKAQP